MKRINNLFIFSISLFIALLIFIWITTPKIHKEEAKLNEVVENVTTNEDVKNLKTKYPDIYGKIHFNSLPNINYPVVMTDNPKTYLYSDLDGKYNGMGVPFVYPKKEENSDFKVVYAHAFTSKKPYMFTDLYKYLDIDFYNKDPFFYIKTEHADKKYLIIGGFQIDTAKDKFYFHKDFFRNEDEKQRWYEEVKKRTPFKIDRQVDFENEVVTLVTCTTDTVGGSKRIVVIGENIN
ncbi:class B sortase [Peptoniphilus harei]|uniref:Class B sortase n=1 Tax=Peptoniphilus harei TaxID=54005 RepID=A0A943XVG4_9FIRM|nr:class B sortase [Peptoniphilus harei]MBS6535410.1 class B sortase [Peptoniphilus harei]